MKLGETLTVRNHLILYEVLQKGQGEFSRFTKEKGAM